MLDIFLYFYQIIFQRNRRLSKYWHYNSNYCGKKKSFSSTRDDQTWHKQCQNNANIYIYPLCWSRRHSNVIFHIDQIDLLSRCHCRLLSSLFFADFECEKIAKHGLEYGNPANDALLSGKTFLWWWIENSMCVYARQKLSLSTTTSHEIYKSFLIFILSKKIYELFIEIKITLSTRARSWRQ